MKVLCIGDSLALPREGCPYESTWFYLLQQAFPQHKFIDYFKRGLLIPEALHLFDQYYKFYIPDVVIIQTGICDCSPRYINDHNRMIIAIKLAFQKFGLESLFWKIVKLRKRRPSCVYTKHEKFKFDYEQLIKKFLVSGANFIILVKIGHATSSVLSRNPLMNSNVDRYNSSIEKIAKENSQRIIVLNPLNDAKEDYFIDGYHCNPKGMDIVFNHIKTVISRIDATTK